MRETIVFYLENLENAISTGIVIVLPRGGKSELISQCLLSVMAPIIGVGFSLAPM